MSWRRAKADNLEDRDCAPPPTGKPQDDPEQLPEDVWGLLQLWQERSCRRRRELEEHLVEARGRARSHALAGETPELEVDGHLAQAGRDYQWATDTLKEMEAANAGLQQDLRYALRGLPGLQRALAAGEAELEVELAEQRALLCREPEKVLHLQRNIEHLKRQLELLQELASCIESCEWRQLHARALRLKEIGWSPDRHQELIQTCTDLQCLHLDLLRRMHYPERFWGEPPVRKLDVVDAVAFV